MVRIQGLSKAYSGGTTSKYALTNVDAEFSNRDFVTVIGANGSGKSTLLNLLAGEIIADRGSIVIDNQDITKWPAYRRAALISRIFQDPLLGTAGELSILDNLRLASLRTRKKTLRNGDTRQYRNKVAGQLARLEMGLEERLDQAVTLLSGGQRQALSLIMAVQDSTRLLLLDEPTSALDPQASARVLAILDQINKENELVILMVSHNMHESIHSGNRLMQLSKGKVYRTINSDKKETLNTAVLYQWIGEAEG